MFLSRDHFAQDVHLQFIVHFFIPHSTGYLLSINKGKAVIVIIQCKQERKYDLQYKQNTLDRKSNSSEVMWLTAAGWRDIRNVVVGKCTERHWGTAVILKWSVYSVVANGVSGAQHHYFIRRGEALHLPGYLKGLHAGHWSHVSAKMKRQHHVPIISCNIADLT